MQKLIMKYPVHFPEDREVSNEFKQFIIDLLNKDWGLRLGSESYEEEICQHALFGSL
jgi:hypothetical protein